MNGKAEFDNGLIFLSSSKSIEHNRIKRKILSKLDNFFSGSKCEPFDDDVYISSVFSDLKIELNEIY